MYEQWSKDLSWSARAFSELAWPVINEIMPGKLVHIEISTDEAMSKQFDTMAGIDAWHIIDGHGIRGIASRVQVCEPQWRPYNTFTVRRERDTGTKTEYEKRKEQIESGAGLIYPHLAIQTYVSAMYNGYLRSVGVALTRDIIGKITRWIESGEPGGFGVYIKRTSNASFFAVDWTADIIKFRYDGV